MTDDHLEPIPAGNENHVAAVPAPPVLDPAQLRRIESVHKGLLYQHLYAAALLLSLGREAGATTVIERDEDIELRRPERTIYIQVKTRQHPLRQSDIASALENFEALRGEHAAGGERQGEARFIIVTNAEPGPVLAADLAAAEWPQDTAIISPGLGAVDGLPHAHATLEGMYNLACEAAAAVPFGGLLPETLMLKMATLIQHASSGARDHNFPADTLGNLLEQLVLQLQDFPNPPSPYRPQRDEPDLVSEQRVRLIIGFSGAGKTSWAAESARLIPEPTLYFDVSDLPPGAVPTNLAREIVARFMGGGTGGVQLPPNGGLDALRYSDQLLHESGGSATIVLDNVHRLRAEDFRQIVESAPHQRFVGLAQPWTEGPLLEATLQIQSETLRGLDEDAIAAIFTSEGSAISYEQAQRVARLTGALPLFVANAAKLTASQYGGDVTAFSAAIEARTQDQDTAQDLILEASFESLPAAAREAAALLGQCDVPLQRAEIDAYLATVGAPAAIAGALRALRRAAFLVEFPKAGLGLHDALRPLAAGHFATLDPAASAAALQALHMQLFLSLRQHKDIPRLTFLVRLLPRVGQTEVLVDLATSEMFYEQGNMAMMWDTLVAAADNPDYSPRDRFWALDALAYWESRDGGTPNEDRVAQMAAIVAGNEFEARERLNLIFKQLIIAGTNQDRQAIERLSAAGRKISRDPMMARILRYNRAVALYRTGAYSAVRSALEPLIADSFAAMGISERQMPGANGERLVRLFMDVEDRDEIKRTADSLNLWATTMTKLDLSPMLRRIQASKLYSLYQAGRSAAVAACDTADDMLHFIGSADGARDAMEQHAFPLIAHYQLTDMILGARSQYAVILAWCGDFAAADQEMEAVLNYDAEPERLLELRNQVVLIEAIRAGLAEPLKPRRSPGGIQMMLNPDQVGRRQRPDDLCACRSGRKYKRCHGKR